MSGKIEVGPENNLDLHPTHHQHCHHHNDHGMNWQWQERSRQSRWVNWKAKAGLKRSPTAQHLHCILTQYLHSFLSSHYIYAVLLTNSYILLLSSHYIYAVLLTNIYIPLLNSHYIYAVLLTRIYIPFLNLFLILHPSSKLLPQHLFLPLTLTNTEILPLNLLYFYGIKSILNAASEKSLPPYLHYRGVANSVTVGLNDKS